METGGSDSVQETLASGVMLNTVPALGPKGPRKVDGIKLPKYVVMFGCY